MNLPPQMPLLAPLAEDQVRDLVIYRETILPRGKGGRPKRGVDKIAQYEQRLDEALVSLIPEVAAARQRVYEQLNVLVDSGQLTKRALLDILYPVPLTPYPARLNDWVREKFLWFDAQGNPAPGPTAAILLQRELDQRKRRLPPPRIKPCSFYCWRWEDSQMPPSSYELPLILQNEGEAQVFKPSPEPGPEIYVVGTPWKGAAWDDESWAVTDHGAARWVGEPDEDTLKRWLLPQEMASLAAAGSPSERAKQALGVLASRLLAHHSSLGVTD